MPTPARDDEALLPIGQLIQSVQQVTNQPQPLHDFPAPGVVLYYGILESV